MTLKNLSLAIFIFAIFGCKSYNEEQLAVKKCYDDFTAALIKKDGKAAASLLSDIDINYYDSILYHAKYSSRQEIAPLLTADKAAIIYARLYFTKEELKQMTAESFFAKSVELGKIANDTNILKAFVIEDIILPKFPSNPISYATLKGYLNIANRFGEYKAMNIKIRRQDGKWKYFQTQNLYQTSGDLHWQIESAKPKQMTEEDFLVQSLCTLYKIDKLDILDNY